MDVALLKSGEGQVRSPSELPDAFDEYRGNMMKWIDGDSSGYKGFYVVALVGGRVAGGGRVRRHAYKRIRHSGNIGLGIHPGFQGIGIGRALMIAMIDWAREHSFADRANRTGGVIRLDLGVFANNHRAIKLYESVGFVRVGHRHGYIRLEDGTLLDDYEMELLLSSGGSASTSG